MNSYGSILKKEWQILLILIIYSIIGIYLLQYYQYGLNSDGISYISIAKEYLNGNFTEAINGYWGPLLSWLLIPFLPFSTPNPQSVVYLTKLLALIAGFFTIIGVKLLISRFEIDKIIETSILFSLVPIILSFSFNVISPDLLVTCILIYYLYFILNPEYSNSMYNGILCGILGAFAYLSKSYALPFFLAHFLLFNIFYYFKSASKEKQRKIFKNLILGITVLFIISGTWIALISDKYGEVTIGTAGSYNHAVVGPQSSGHFVYYHGLITPPNNSSVSAWEDPSYFKMISWSPFESWDKFNYQLMLIQENIIKMIGIFEFFSLLSIIIIIASILLIFKLSSKDTSKDKLIYLITTILIYCGGYSFILVEMRYLWLLNILLIITGGYLLSLSFKIGFLSKVRRNILLIFLILSFTMIPINGLITDLDIGKGIYNTSETLEYTYNVHGNLASNNEWEITDYIAYYTGSKYYGETKSSSNINDLKRELESNNIDYYIVWGKSDENAYLSHYFKEITNGKVKYLKVYKLKTNNNINSTS